MRQVLKNSSVVFFSWVHTCMRGCNKLYNITVGPSALIFHMSFPIIPKYVTFLFKVNK